ncbi:MAG: transposase [Methanobrevibacter sp.]|uniref:transposase n=1 Tax=Methanobrevibacter sp. TaxID=66852 RepID=UPI0025D9AEBF|nr:transposase [Methanobrevibacter sp.]MBE6507931.1 transposase [Methanobrevibacter sp.]
MPNINKSVLNSNLNFIQLKLYDFSDEKIDQEKIISERLNKVPNFENTNSKLFLDENNTFKYDTPIYPVCGSHKIIKKGTITKNKQNINGKTTEFKEQQYQCKKCNKKFGISNNPLIGKNKQYLQEIMNKIPRIMKIGYQSLRKISKYFQIFLGIRISHQTIKNWSNQNHEETITNEEFEYSGYYLYDEQFLRLNGVRHYRLTLYDAILNIPVSERIVRRRIPKNTKKFILDSTANKPFICLTTDLFPMYRNVADEIGVKHQLYKFHLFQTINHKLKVHCRRNKINGKARDHIYENANELKNCFRQNSKQEAINQFKQYLQNYRAIPVVLKDFIRKHIIMHFHRYVEHLDDENIEKTSNKVENYYRQTNPEKIKKLYKTKNGILTFLDFQMQNWTQKHIKIK